MGFSDNLKGFVEKGKKAAADNSDKIENVVDKAGDFIDNKTDGKYADKVNKAQQAAKNAIPDK
jgi:MT0933-like antitoxin protein